MPRPRNTNLDRWEWPDIPGFLMPYEREGRKTYAVHHYKRRRKASGLLFEPRYKRVARKLHEEWVQEMILREHGLIVDENPVDLGAPQSVLAGQKEYVRVKQRTMAENGLIKFRQAIAAHFEHDLPWNHDRIHDHVVASINSGSYADSTLRKHIAQLNRFFEYAVQRQWIDRNPINLIDSPKEPARDVEVWSRKELERIKKWITKHSQAHQKEWIVLAIEWLSITAMRPSEMLRMRWAHVQRDELTIPKTKTAKPRAVPLRVSAKVRREHPERAEWVALVAKLLDELRTLYNDRRQEQLESGRKAPSWPEGNVWPWEEVKTVRKEFGLAREALGLEDGRRLYDLRASAEDHWVWDLGFGIDQVCAYGGHSPAVYVKFYKRRYGAKDRRRLLET